MIWFGLIDNSLRELPNTWFNCCFSCHLLRCRVTITAFALCWIICTMLPLAALGDSE